jgi:eukaryotic-like serine/threonine-protein kinase
MATPPDVPPPDVPPPDVPPDAAVRPGPPPPPEREWWPWLGLLLLLVVAGLLIWLFAIRGNDDKTTVPKVVGMPSQAAVARLHEKHLKDVPFSGPSSRPKGVVFAQQPGAGRRVKKGATVQISISSGPARVSVPDVTGLSEAVAKQRLAAAGFPSTRIKRVASSHPKGIVVDQAPLAGVSATKGTTVELSVSSGRKPVVVPSLVGSTQGAAVAVLARRGLKAKLQNVPSTKPIGQVVAQKPPAGKEVDKGSAVMLNVSRGTGGGGTTTSVQTTTTARTVTTTTRPVTTTASAPVPNVRGLNQAPAARRLTAAGFRPRFTYVASSRPAGRVLQQTPAAGARRARGARVRLTVSSGPSPKPLKAVPDVIGQDQAAAVSTLRAAGFRVVVLNEQTTDQTQDGIVIDQDPEGGTRIPRGSQVAIFVGRFSGG